MTFLKTTAIALIVTAGAATAADAAATGAFAPLEATPALLIPVVNGYGPLPYGLAGHRHRTRARRSYGTGYHGRGTATGGPVGGLPSRN